MHGPRFRTLATTIVALAAGGSLYGQTGAGSQTGDDVLRTHGHGIHAAPAPGVGMTDTSMLGTITVAAAPTRHSVEAGNRAGTDSLALANTALHEELAGLIHFEFDRSGIQPADRAVLDHKVAILSAHPGIRVRIAGYCDGRGADGYNLALGNRRAAVAKQYLIERGIDAGRLDAVSFGSTSPVDAGQNEAAWALNRRAGFEVASDGDALTVPVGPLVGTSN